MQANKFDDSNLTWASIDWLENVWFYVYNVDRKNGIVDVIFKFAANSKAMMHQHKTPYITLVLQGELRFYRPDGELKEIRPTGSYVMGVAMASPIPRAAAMRTRSFFFSDRNVEDALYEFLDENMKPTVTLRIGDFEEALRAQGRPSGRRPPELMERAPRDARAPSLAECCGYCAGRRGPAAIRSRRWARPQTRRDRPASRGYMTPPNMTMCFVCTGRLRASRRCFCAH